jgi:hypothetical protein
MRIILRLAGLFGRTRNGVHVIACLTSALTAVTDCNSSAPGIGEWRERARLASRTSVRCYILVAIRGDRLCVLSYF